MPSEPGSVQPDLTGKVAAVSGAGRGIGRAVALGVAEAGGDVVITARSADQLASVATEVEALGRQVRTVIGDIAADGTCEKVAAAAEELGSLDLLVANAGMLATGDHDPDPVAELRRVVDVNLVGAYALIEACLPLLRDRGGRILVVGSGAGHRPSGSVAYSASKAGLSMMVRVLAPMLRPDGVAIDEIVPGPVATDLIGPIIEHVRESSSVAPNDWIKDPDDVVPLVLFVAGLPADGPTGQRWSLCARDL